MAGGPIHVDDRHFWELLGLVPGAGRPAVTRARPLARKPRTRLLVCSLPMPPGERDGLARECRERQSRIKLIFLAAPSPGEKTPEAGPSCPYRVLPKPINLNQLSEAVRELLGR